VILRATQKVLRLLPTATDLPVHSSSALGDWYVNRIVIDRRPLLLLVSANSLLSILSAARDVATLPERLPWLVATRLKRLGIPAAWIEAERAAMEPIVVARTNSRSVLGTMRNFAIDISWVLPASGWDDAFLPLVEARLEDTPCHVAKRDSDVVWPSQRTRELLKAAHGS